MGPLKVLRWRKINGNYERVPVVVEAVDVAPEARSLRHIYAKEMEERVLSGNNVPEL